MNSFSDGIKRRNKGLFFEIFKKSKTSKIKRKIIKRSLSIILPTSLFLGMSIMTYAEGIHFGKGASAVDGSVAIGQNTESKKDNSVTIGKQAVADGEDSFALGTFARTSERNALAIGYDANASGADSLALGTKANAKVRNALAIGYDANASGEDSLALGTKANAKARNALGIGYDTNAIGENSTAIGTKALTKGIFSTSVGYGASAYSDKTVAIGNGSNVKGEFSIGIGHNTKTFDSSSVAIGKCAQARGVLSVAMGDSAIANGQATSVFGAKNVVNGQESVGVGFQSQITGNAAIALGTQLEVKGDYAIGVGGGAYVNAESAIAIGTNSASIKEGAIALGSDSLANVERGKKGWHSKEIEINEKLGMWKSTNGAISIGSNEKGNIITRQIVNVAAGSEDSDAVNVAQLKSVYEISVKYDTKEKNKITLGDKSKEKVAITNLKEGEISENSTDAVNGSQIYKLMQSNVSEIQDIGAAVAALSALHVQDFDDEDRWDIAVGYGNYKNSNAFAIGAFYRPNERTLFSVGGTIGGRENLFNMGMTLKFGEDDEKELSSKTELIKVVKEQKNKIENLEKEVLKEKGIIKKLLLEDEKRNVQIQKLIKEMYEIKNKK